MPQGNRKQGRSYSLSRESVDYVDKVSKQRKENASVIVDDLIRRAKAEDDRDRARARLDSAFTAYYDSLTEEQQAEDREWGKFAEGQLPTE